MQEEHSTEGEEKKMTKKEKAQILEMAKKEIYTVEKRGDLEQRGNDEDDFIEVGVYSLERALHQAYELGKNAK